MIIQSSRTSFSWISLWIVNSKTSEKQWQEINEIILIKSHLRRGGTRFRLTGKGFERSFVFGGDRNLQFVPTSLCAWVWGEGEWGCVCVCVFNCFCVIYASIVFIINYLLVCLYMYPQIFCTIALSFPRFFFIYYLRLSLPVPSFLSS